MAVFAGWSARRVPRGLKETSAPPACPDHGEKLGRWAQRAWMGWTALQAWMDCPAQKDPRVRWGKKDPWGQKALPV